MNTSVKLEKLRNMTNRDKFKIKIQRFYVIFDNILTFLLLYNIYLCRRC